VDAIKTMTYADGNHDGPQPAQGVHVKRYATAFSYHISENNIFHGSQIGTKSGIILVLSIDQS
jgi:hypothetical protein